MSTPRHQGWLVSAPRKVPRARLQRVIDVGPYNTLQCHVVIPAGTGNANDHIILQHSAINEDNAFFDVGGVGNISVQNPCGGG